jgi:c-di-GMP-related signal transduction protein
MDIFVARQPIFNRNRKVVAYELLFRSGMENYFNHHDPDEASSRVIDGSLIGFGLDRLTAGKRAFLNFTRRILVSELYSLLPPKYAVVELLENIDPDQDVLTACQNLKTQGFTLALDDFVFDPKYRALISLADIIKVDFMLSSPAERRALATELENDRVELLAEKIETHDDFTEALDLGYRYFQGYFFCRPEIVTGREIPGFKLNYLRFLQEVNRPEIDFDRLEGIIKQELSLSVKLLRYLNSASFGWRHEVTSIRQAIRIFGERQIKKWASLVAMMHMGEDKPSELVLTSLARARLCELLGAISGFRERELELFLMGLLSLIDALVDRAMEDVLAELQLSDDIRNTLLGVTTPFSPVLSIVRLYERGDWDEMTPLFVALNIEEQRVAELYGEAVAWADGAFTTSMTE